MHMFSQAFCLKIILAFLCVAIRHATKIVLLGDSVDRHIVEDWCLWSSNTVHEFKTHVKKWGPKSLNYGGITEVISPSYCVNSLGDSIASIHLFGSTASGPYHVDKWEQDNSEFEVRESEFRTTKGIQIYVEHFGLPDKVFFKTANWDSLLLTNNRNPLAVNNYVQNTLDRLKDIRSVLNDTVEVGVITCPHNYAMYTFTPQLNDQLRQLAANLSLLLYDFDYDVWSTAGSNGFNFTKSHQIRIFRGGEYDLHPNVMYSVLAGEKLLGNAFSGYYEPKGIPYANISDNVYMEIPKHYKDFLFVRRMISVEGDVRRQQQEPADSYFYLQWCARNSSWLKWSQVEPGYLSHLHLSPADVMPLRAQVLDAIPLVAEIPRHVLRILQGHVAPDEEKVKRRGFTTLGGLMILVNENQEHFLLNNFDDFKHFGVAEENIIANLPDWWKWPFLHREGISVSDFLSVNGTLVRAHKEKQVYIIFDGKLRAINSVAVLVKYGYDFDDVKATSKPGELSLLSIGEPLT